MKILASIVMIPILHFPTWTNAITGKPVTKVQCSETLRKPLLNALECLKRRNATKSLKTYHGCYNYRNIRGTNRLSQHAFGQAIDINAGLPYDKNVVECFEAAGFTWGGRWPGKKRDPMHFQIRRK